MRSLRSRSTALSTAVFAAVAVALASSVVLVATSAGSAEALTEPGRPTVTQSTPGPHAVTVTFDPPPSDGGSPITSYTATCNNINGGGVDGTANGPSSPITVSGLSADKSYRCRVRATNADGTGLPSAYGATVTLPGFAPSITSVVPSAGAVTVTVAPPADSSGGPVLRYTVRCTSQFANQSGIASDVATTITVSGLVARKRYECKAQATTAVGTSPASAGRAVDVLDAAPPGPPSVVSLEPTVSGLLVSFTPPPTDNGSPVTQYTAECRATHGPGDPAPPGTATGSGSPITVGGLTSGRTYKCRVLARNAYGTGENSTYSSGVQVP